jgi:hypothetical protein
MKIIRDDRYHLSPRIRTLKAIVAKIRQEPARPELRRHRSNMRTRGPPRENAASKRQGKAKLGPPMTLGGAVAAGVRIIVWCRDCSHQVEPDPSDQARRYGETMSVLDWRDRLVCSRCGSRAIDMVLTGARHGD